MVRRAGVVAACAAGLTVLVACTGSTPARHASNDVPVPVLTGPAATGAGATGPGGSSSLPAGSTASVPVSGRPAPLASSVAISGSTAWGYGTPGHLPVDQPAGNAQQVVTIAASSTSATTATLRAWQRDGASWVPYGPPVVAHVGRSGITSHESEALTASPVGSYALTEAFGRLPNPGTRLPYFQTSPSDWWISQPGQYYNTHQVCSANCPFNTGTPNARLYYVAPQYDLAVVIDYNRTPVVQGAGSGIFLHVTAGRPTNGCISVALPDLARVMRWLNPAAHPRILIGVQD